MSDGGGLLLAAAMLATGALEVAVALSPAVASLRLVGLGPAGRSAGFGGTGRSAAFGRRNSKKS